MTKQQKEENLKDKKPTTNVVYSQQKQGFLQNIFTDQKKIPLKDFLELKLGRKLKEYEGLMLDTIIKDNYIESDTVLVTH